MNKKIIEDEIDLLGLIVTVWENQLKIYIITVITLIISLGYYSSQNSTYNVTTNIETISIFEEREYASYNLYLQNFFLDKFGSDEESEALYETSLQTINKTYLVNLFINTLREKNITKDLIKKSNLINKKDYDDNQKYENAVSKLVNSINLVRQKKADTDIDYWTINFRTKNINEWNNFLNSIEKPLNENVRAYLNNSVDQLIVTQKRFLTFKIEDLERKISDQKNYTVNTKLQNAANRIAFLQEQAQIARSLNIENFDVDKFNSLGKDSTLLYYTRGYRLIEEEIRLISNLNNSNISLSTNTLEELKTELLISKKNIDRFEEFINETPFKKSNNFLAAKVNLLSTNYIDDKIPLKKTVVYAFLLGIILGVFFVVTQKAIKNRR